MADEIVSQEFIGAMYLVGQLYGADSFSQEQLKTIDRCLASIYILENGTACDNDTMSKLVKSEGFRAHADKMARLIDQREEEGILKKKEQP